MIEKNYEYGVPQFLCWWEDTIGLYTEEELYNQYKDTNLYDVEDQIGWGAYCESLGKSLHYDTFQQVLEFYKETDDYNYKTEFVSDNMHIIRVI